MTQSQKSLQPSLLPKHAKTWSEYIWKKKMLSDPINIGTTVTKMITYFNKTRNMSIGHRCPNFPTYVTKVSDRWTRANLNVPPPLKWGLKNNFITPSLRCLTCVITYNTWHIHQIIVALKSQVKWNMKIKFLRDFSYICIWSLNIFNIPLKGTDSWVNDLFIYLTNEWKTINHTYLFLNKDNL